MTTLTPPPVVSSPPEEICPALVSPRAMTIPGLGAVTWVVAEVRPRHEKAVAFDLMDAGFDYFLPLVKRVTVSHRRRRAHYVPIDGLGGYVFAASRVPPDKGEHIPTRLLEFLCGHRDIFELISIHPAAQAIFSAEITALHGAVMTGKLADAGKIEKGTACRVKHGPYMGHAGVVDDLRKNGWVILPITTLGRKVAIEIAVDDLEPIDPTDLPAVA